MPREIYYAHEEILVDGRPRRLRAPHRRARGGAHPVQGQAAARPARAARELNLLRRGRRGDAVLLHPARAQPWHQGRLAADPGQPRLLQRHQEAAQRAAGRRDQPHRAEEGGLPGGQFPERPAHGHGLRLRGGARPSTAAADRSLPPHLSMGVALPRRPVGAQPGSLDLFARLRREVRRSRRVSARVRAGHRSATGLRHAGDQPVFAEERRPRRRRDQGSAGSLRHPGRPAHRRADLAL